MGNFIVKHYEAAMAQHLRRKHRDTDALLRISTQIYCTWLSLGREICMPEITRAAFELYDAVTGEQDAIEE